MVNEKRLEQLKEAWLKNVMKIMGKTREEAEELYNKLQPYSQKSMDALKE